MNDINTTYPFICKCAECMKLGPLYANIGKKDNNLLIPECNVIKEESNEKPMINKKQLLNIGWIFILLFLIISSKFLK